MLGRTPRVGTGAAAAAAGAQQLGAPPAVGSTRAHVDRSGARTAPQGPAAAPPGAYACMPASPSYLLYGAQLARRIVARGGERYGALLKLGHTCAQLGSARGVQI